MYIVELASTNLPATAYISSFFKTLEVDLWQVRKAYYDGLLLQIKFIYTIDIFREGHTYMVEK